MMSQFEERGRPVFRCSSPLSRGPFKTRGGGELFMHHNAEPQTAEFLLKSISSVFAK